MKRTLIARCFALIRSNASALGTILLLTAFQALAYPPGSIVDWGHPIQTPPAPSSHYKAIAAGTLHDMVLEDDGTIIIWAAPGGDASDILTNTARGMSNVAAIAASGANSMALFSNGTVVVWGDNYDGETNTPAGLNNVMAIASGAYHCLALQSNANIVSWGGDYVDDDNNTVLPPTNILIKAVASGQLHGLALLQNGTVIAWGNNHFFDLNTTNFDVLYVGQAVVPANLTDVKAIAAGAYHSLALRGDGTVVAWGWSGDGQTNVPPGLTNVVAISAGYSHSVALKSDGTVAVWGDNSYFQTNTPFGLTNVIAISAEYDHTIALVGTPSVSTPPGLQHQLSGNHFIVTWPSPATGFSLQTTTNFSQSNSWTSVAITPVVINSQNTVTNNLTNGSHFYRLLKP